MRTFCKAHRRVIERGRKPPFPRAAARAGSATREGLARSDRRERARTNQPPDSDAQRMPLGVAGAAAQGKGAARAAARGGVPRRALPFGLVPKVRLRYFWKK